MIPTLIDATLVAVVGPVASGKTFLLKQWANPMRRVAVFDPTREWDDLQNTELFDRTPRAFAEYLKKHPTQFRAVYFPLATTEAGRMSVTQESFGTVASAMWQLDEPRWLIVEEVHHVMSPWNVHPKMVMIMKYTRKRLMGVVGATQRFSNMHREFIGACRLVVVFNPGNDAPSLSRIGEMWGKDTEEQVRNLRPLIFDDARGTVSQTPQALIVERGQPPRVEDIG